MDDDPSATEILGPKCPSCGWRRGDHRPVIGENEACPEWVALETSEETA